MGSIVKKTKEEATSQALEIAEKSARAERDKLLKETDWTQLPDAPVSTTEWVEYRDKLRKIPLQEGFPLDIQWPVKPQ